MLVSAHSTCNFKLHKLCGSIRNCMYQEASAFTRAAKCVEGSMSAGAVCSRAEISLSRLSAPPSPHPHTPADRCGTTHDVTQLKGDCLSSINRKILVCKPILHCCAVQHSRVQVTCWCTTPRSSNVFCTWRGNPHQSHHLAAHVGVGHRSV